MAVAVMVTFYGVGIWHGTTLNFVAFGLLQGAGVIFSASFESAMRGVLGKQRSENLANNKLFHGGSIFITLNFTCISFLFLENQPADLGRVFSLFFFGP